jgi:hypothetical protein
MDDGLGRHVIFSLYSMLGGFRSMRKCCDGRSSWRHDSDEDTEFTLMERHMSDLPDILVDLAREQRDRGAYDRALSELNAANSLYPANDEIAAEIDRTRRACKLKRDWEEPISSAPQKQKPLA